MLLFVNADTQEIVSAAITEQPVQEIRIPRASNVPIHIQFVRDGVVYDPEATIATILTSSEANPTVITTDGAHGFTTGDSVTIEDHTGDPKAISYSSISPFYTATITVASPAVVTTATLHGLAAGDPIKFETDDALPSGIVSGVTYFVLSTSLTTTTFRFALTAGGSAINTSGTQSGTHTVTLLKSAVTCAAHGFADGDVITIAGHEGTDVDINATQVISGSTTDTFLIPLELTVGGFGGTATREISTPTINGVHTITKTSDTTFTIPVTVTKAGVGGTATRITAIDLVWTVKSEGQFDQDPPLVLADEFVKEGTGNTTIFKASANYITEALNAELGIDAVIQQTCTITNASPAVVTVSSHSFIAGDIVTFTTTGTLPTGLTVGLQYYIISAGLTGTAFEVSLSSGGAAINTSSAGSGTHTVTRVQTADDVEEAEAMAEISWGGEFPGKTHWVDHLIRNDLNKTGDTAPINTGAAYGRVAIGNGDDTATITFGSALPSANWRPEVMLVDNVTDVTPLNIFACMISAKATTGFTIQLNGATDSSNYYLNYKCVP